MGHHLVEVCQRWNITSLLLCFSLVINTEKKNETAEMELILEREDSLISLGYGRKSQTKLWTESGKYPFWYHYMNKLYTVFT